MIRRTETPAVAGKRRNVPSPRDGSLPVHPAAPPRRPDLRGDPGVHLPFLAPMLSGVRLRCAAHGLEFILPNPSGGRGVYVASWGVVTGFAAPAPHDTLLVGRLSGLGRIGPAEVRDAARIVALEGFAGADAAGAARNAQLAVEASVARLRVLFVRSAARSAGFGPEWPTARLIERSGFTELANRLGWRPTELATALQDLSLRCASVMTGSGTTGSGVIGSGGQPGLPEHVPDGGRWRRMTALLQRLRHSLAGELYGRGDLDALLLGRVVAAADRCLRICEDLLPRIEALLADPLAELEACRNRGAGAAVPWLDEMELALDGWDRIGLLWFDAADGRAKGELIPEIAALARTGGGDGWSGTGARPDNTDRHPDGTGNDRRQARLQTRNERIRTLELAFEVHGS